MSRDDPDVERGDDAAGPTGTDTADGDAPDDGPDDDTDAATASTDTRRHDRLDRHPTGGPRNSMWRWPAARHPLRVTVNYLVVWLIRVAPSLRLKNRLLRLLGATVGPGVAFGLEATPDVFWPELLTIERDAVVGYGVTLLCHEFLQDEYRTGEVVIGERAMIGAGAVVLPGVEVGPGAQVAANSLVTRDVSPGATVAGVPAREVDGGTG